MTPATIMRLAYGLAAFVLLLGVVLFLATTSSPASDVIPDA